MKKKGGVTLKVTEKTKQAAIPQLKSFKDAIASIEQVQHFLEFIE